MILTVILLCYVAAAAMYLGLRDRKNSLADGQNSSWGNRIAAVPIAAPPSSEQIQPSTLCRWRQKQLLSPAERSFYTALKQAAGAREVFIKIRIADLLQPEPANRDEWRADYQRIAEHYFDFVICGKNSLTALAAIRLNDSARSEALPDGLDQSIRSACKNAKIPFIAIKTKDRYEIAQLKKLIALF